MSLILPLLKHLKALVPNYYELSSYNDELKEVDR